MWGSWSGFDIEGLAVIGSRLLLGLRGPVLRGWAVLLEIEPELSGDSTDALVLKQIGPGRRCYRKHFFALNGLGVRDLCTNGDDLLILAGPTMDLDGPVTIFRLRSGFTSDEESVVFADQLEKVLEVPFGQGADHAEGICLIESGEQLGEVMLIVYDSAAESRKHGDTDVEGDLFILSQPRAAVTYGVQGALYRPSREQIYQVGLQALECLDRLYGGFNSAEGEALAAPYLGTLDWTNYSPRYYATLSVVKQYETEYRFRVLDIPSTVNNLLAEQQPSAEQSYAFISSVISGSIPPPPGSDGSTKDKNGKVQTIEGTFEISFPDLEDRVQKSWKQDEAFKAAPNRDCPTLGNLAPMIRRDPAPVTELTAEIKNQFVIENSCGTLTATVTPQDSSDKNAIDTKILTDKGVFSLEVEAKAKTKKPVWVSVVDYGRGGVSSGFWVNVK